MNTDISEWPLKGFSDVLPGLCGIEKSFAGVRAEGSDSLKKSKRMFCDYRIMKEVNVSSEEK